jgi:uncharacterized membrane protein YqjE
MSQGPVGEKSFQVRRGRVGSVEIYEVKENELDILEKGSPAGLYLNFAIFLLSIAFSALVALFTTATLKYAFVQTVFIVVVVVGFLGGIFLLFLWRRERKDVKDIIKIIRDRIPPEAPSSLPCGPSATQPTEEPSGPTGPTG